LLVLGFAKSFIKGIADTGHGENRITFATDGQVFAKTSYVDVDCSIVDVDGRPPNALQQVLARKNAARSLKQAFEQPEFCSPDTDVAQAPTNPSRLAIKLKIASNKQVVRNSKPAAPQ
jgi:hypothetical protein